MLAVHYLYESYAYLCDGGDTQRQLHDQASWGAVVKKPVQKFASIRYNIEE